MSLGLTRRDRRTALVGAGIVAGLVALAKGMPVWRAWDAEVRASAAELVAESARAERSVRALPVVRDSLIARNARYLALAELIVPGDGPTSAAGELATFVSGAATASDLTVGALQVRVDTTALEVEGRTVGSPLAPAFARVSVQGDLTGDVLGLTYFLSEIEDGPFLLSIRELAVSQPEPAAPADRPEMLRVQFVVEGIALRGGANAASREPREEGGAEE